MKSIGLIIKEGISENEKELNEYLKTTIIKENANINCNATIFFDTSRNDDFLDIDYIFEKDGHKISVKFRMSEAFNLDYIDITYALIEFAKNYFDEGKTTIKYENSDINIEEFFMQFYNDEYEMDSTESVKEQFKRLSQLWIVDLNSEDDII